MGKTLLMALIAALILSAGWLDAQDSSDSSDTSSSTDTSTAAAVSDVSSPDAVSVTDVSDPTVTAEATVVNPTVDPTNTALAFAAQQAYDAVNDPWGGTPQPIDFASGFVDEAAANAFPGAPA